MVKLKWYKQIIVEAILPRIVKLFVLFGVFFNFWMVVTVCDEQTLLDKHLCHNLSQCDQIMQWHWITMTLDKAFICNQHSVNTEELRHQIVLYNKHVSITTVIITVCLSAGHVPTDTDKATSIRLHPHHCQCDVLRRTCFIVSVPLSFVTKWIQTGWHLVLMCFVKWTFPTELTCNHSANKLSVVASIVLCV